LSILRAPESDDEEPDFPRIGTEIVDDSLSRVGRVVDVFGPVERPYLAVSPDDGVDPAALVGSRLYAQD
jgi:RNA-binding protein